MLGSNPLELPSLETLSVDAEQCMCGQTEWGEEGVQHVLGQHLQSRPKLSRVFYTCFVFVRQGSTNVWRLTGPARRGKLSTCELGPARSVFP